MEKMQVEVLGEYSLSVDQYGNDEQESCPSPNRIFSVYRVVRNYFLVLLSQFCRDIKSPFRVRKKANKNQ